MAQAAPVEPKKLFPTWSCELQPLKEPINVGSRMNLMCKGDYIEKLKTESLRFEFKDPKEQWTLVILEPKNIDNQRVDLVVTSYVAGQHQTTDIMLGDGEKAFYLGPLNWTVASVVDSQKKVEPYGPFGPFDFSMPWWYWGTILLVVLAVLLVAMRRFRRYYDRKKLINSLASYNTAMPPFHQFSKDLRACLKLSGLQSKKMEPEQASEMVASLNKLVREYILRQFVIPTFNWSNREILNEFKKRHRKFYRENEKDLRRLFREFDRASKARTQLSEADCEQLVSMSKSLTEKMHNFSKAGS